MENIKTLRIARNLTQEKLGKKIGVTAAAINRWENGKRKPHSVMLKAIAKALKVRVDELTGNGTTPE